MNAPELVETVEAAGGVLTLNGTRITYEVPEGIASILSELRAHRDEVMALLANRANAPPTHCYVHGDVTTWWQRPATGWVCQRCHPSLYRSDTQDSYPPPMPPGVRLMSWKLEKPPVALTRCTVVADPAKFAHTTLKELQAALDRRQWFAGNWSVRELVERLEQVGVKVVLEDAVQDLDSGSGVQRD
jgi:hypothetical protein